MKNPFSLNFGKEPVSFIARDEQNIDIIESVKAQNAEFQVCMLTGIRGSGKTVSMSAVANDLAKDEQWIVVDLTPERDLLQNLAAELYKRTTIKQIFENAKFTFTVPGLGMEISKASPVTDIAVTVGEALDALTKKGKKLLITIDEVINNHFVREFVSMFQIYMRKNYNVYLIMTGLYDNIYDLQNEKTLTFLYRAPKIKMKPLSIPMIMRKYQDIFKIPSEDALAMAKLTKGYPYAFQVLGYCCFKHNAGYLEVIDEFDAFLFEYVYQKIWSELSDLDKDVLCAIIKNPYSKAETIRKELNMSVNKYSVYRDRLLRKGVINSAGYGKVELALPRFAEFIKSKLL